MMNFLFKHRKFENGHLLLEGKARPHGIWIFINFIVAPSGELVVCKGHGLNQANLQTAKVQARIYLQGLSR
jgi:hypothetical protein